METALLKIVNISIAAGWLILVVLFIRFVFRKAPKVIRCILWAFVAVKLICPFSFESVLSLIPSGETISPDIVYFHSPVINSGIPLVNRTVNPILRNTFAKEVGASVNSLQSYTFAAAAVWLSGIAVMLLFLAVSYLRLCRRVRASMPLRDNIFLCDSIESPFILGVFRPKIYLPSAMEQGQIDYVLAHEAAHLKRLDHLWKPFGFLILSVYWFHPLCWVGYLLFCKDIELACDEKVIGQMGTAHKKRYAETLLSCSVSRRSVSACPLAFGEAAVRERILSILYYRKPAFGVILVAIIICVVTSVCFLTNPKRPVSGADVENVHIKLIGMDLYGEKPYIEYELINHRDEQITLDQEFSIYRMTDRKELSVVFTCPPGMVNRAFTIESGKNLSFFYGLFVDDFFIKSTYRLEQRFFTDDGIRHTACIEFQVD